MGYNDDTSIVAVFLMAIISVQLSSSQSKTDLLYFGGLIGLNDHALGEVT